MPHDAHDWDAVQVPVLVDSEWQGRPRKLIYWAHRGGFYYVLDRATGEFLLGKPFAKQTWAKEIDAKGRPDTPAQYRSHRGGQRGLAGRAGRHQLVFAVLQSR